MAFLELSIFSESLGTQQQVYVIMPQQSTNGEIGINNKSSENIKTLYLLHGLSDNHSTWIRRTSVERYAQEYGICVVMPFADRSFYTNMKHGGEYYTYIAKELPQIIGQMFNVSNKREDRFIAGNSMGGYGALKIGMRECDAFSAAAGISPVADVVNSPNNWWLKDFKNIFGEEVNIPAEDDLFEIAKESNKNLNKPRIYTFVGTEDFLYEDNQKLKKHFESLNFDYTYEETKGSHSWELWDKYIQRVIKWMLKV